jgi:hypothetical protein
MNKAWTLPSRNSLSNEKTKREITIYNTVEPVWLQKHTKGFRGKTGAHGEL